MRANPTTDVYSAREIALAVNVSEADVRAALAGIGIADGYAGHADAVRIGRALAARSGRGRPGDLRPTSLFTLHSTRPGARANGLPLAVSSTLHVGFMAVLIFLTTFGLAPRAATIGRKEHATPMRLIFLALPGPGGGGGGGGLLQKAAPPTAQEEGHQRLNSPLPTRQRPTPIVVVRAPVEPIAIERGTEPVRPVVAPIAAMPADPRTRAGVLAQATAQSDSRGPGAGGGAGTGAGTGIGEGSGPGVGTGSDGGTGGGPYRPGSGIDAPRLLREVKADYTDEARRRNLEGDVDLEIVVRSDGAVSGVRLLKGLGAGLDDRAVQAVRQWRFSPARRLGTPVDVIVQVSVEFNLR